ncbi:MAG: acetyl-CoA C-acetyltransferase, partial [Gammaproteobacteria bacterium]|nr:acetyl-CoA C-acetyltransferase [Gammaproteobacteria bacterium]
MSNDPIVIAAARRTAIGSLLGQFARTTSPELGAAAIEAAVADSGVKGEDISEVIMGCVLPAAVGQAPARQAAIGAGIPKSVGCTTINKVCGSGMKAVMFSHDLIAAGSADIMVAGGMESMTNAPHMVHARAGIKYGDAKLIDHMAWDGLVNPYDGQAMGVFGEQCAEKFGFSREDQDAFAIESVKRSQRAIEDGSFQAEIAPVTVKSRKGEVAV